MNIIETMTRFSTQEKCINYLESKRWGGVPVCPYCDSENVYKAKDRFRHHCNGCRTSFSVTVGTIFHDTRLSLVKWFLLITLMLNAKKGLSACQAARDLGVRRPTVWSMMHRIRKAMLEDQGLLSGIVEMDETYIGGKPRKGGKKDDDNTPNKRGRGTKKQAVVGMIERQGNVITHVAEENKMAFTLLYMLVKKYINLNSATLYTDEYTGYSRMKSLIKHKQVNHSKGIYSVNGVSTNSIESFWAIVKRGMMGQFHWVSKKYLAKYMDEFTWRFNNRENKNNFDDLVGNMLFS